MRAKRTVISGPSPVSGLTLEWWSLVAAKRALPALDVELSTWLVGGRRRAPVVPGRPRGVERIAMPDFGSGSSGAVSAMRMPAPSVSDNDDTARNGGLGEGWCKRCLHRWK